MNASRTLIGLLPVLLTVIISVASACRFPSMKRIPADCCIAIRTMGPAARLFRMFTITVLIFISTAMIDIYVSAFMAASPIAQYRPGVPCDAFFPWSISHNNGAFT